MLPDKWLQTSLVSKSTDELLDIWIKNDRRIWSAAAFESMKEILVERGIDVPQQKILDSDKKTNLNVGDELTEPLEEVLEARTELPKETVPEEKDLAELLEETPEAQTESSKETTPKQEDLSEPLEETSEARTEPLKEMAPEQKDLSEPLEETPEARTELPKETAPEQGNISRTPEESSVESRSQITGEVILAVVWAEGKRLVITTQGFIVARYTGVERVQGIFTLVSKTLGRIPVVGILLDMSITAIAYYLIRIRTVKKRLDTIASGFTPAEILSANKRTYFIPWCEVTQAKVKKRKSSIDLRIITVKKRRGKFFKVRKHVFKRIEGKIVGKCLSVINKVIRERISYPRNRKKFNQMVSKLKFIAPDYISSYLRCNGFNCKMLSSNYSEIPEIATVLSCYSEDAVFEISNRNLARIEFYDRRMVCFLHGVKAHQRKIRVKRKRHTLKWVGDKKISKALTEDVLVADLLFNEMRSKRVKNLYIPRQKNKPVQIIVKIECLPTKSLMEVLDKIAGYLHGSTR